VLLVDDEPEFLRTLTKRLGKRDLEVRGAPGGKEALRALAEQEADVVVLDVKMPGMDGIETLRRIKQDHPLVEVIMLTGHADVEAAVQGMEMGAFDYLMKPMDIDELLYKVQDAHKKKLLQEDKIREKQESLG
jgi:DNA-binding NtrC family response regulator